MTTIIPVVDLRAQYLAHKAEIDAAVHRTLDSGWYILGKEVAAFEEEFAAYLSSAGPAAPEGQAPTYPRPGCVGVNSGTDALHLALWACDIGPGDEVITAAHSAVATAAAIRLAGATPVFVDIDPDTYTIDPAAVASAITPRSKAVLPVHLYGHPAEMYAIMAVARQYGLRVIEDCAQAHGAAYRGQRVGSFGDLGCFSFYPTKNLGALGDGGAVVSSNLELLERVRRLREYGWTPQSRYISQEEGMNSRLDELQAAVLRVRLRHLDAENAMRRTLAGHYARLLPDGPVKPIEAPGCAHIYHLYVVRVADRNTFRQRLQELGVATAIHYPAPIHRQPAYSHDAFVPELPHTERITQEIVTLPMHPFLTSDDIEHIADAVRQALCA